MERFKRKPYINDKKVIKFLIAILFESKFVENREQARLEMKSETNNCNKKLSRYKNYINVAEITGTLLSSIATNATSTSVAMTGIGLPYSITTAFATATVCGSLSKTINTKIRSKIIMYLQMYILSKQFSDNFNKLYIKSVKDNKIDNDECNDLVRIYEEYKKSKKNTWSVFLN